jgi:hypothetical protein
MRKQSFSTILWRVTGCLVLDALRFVSLGFRSQFEPAAENLFLRKQPALFAERGVRPRRADDATRITLVVLARLLQLQIMVVASPRFEPTLRRILRHPAEKLLAAVSPSETL